jgi:hypothetical protein
VEINWQTLVPLCVFISALLGGLTWLMRQVVREEMEKVKKELTAKESHDHLVKRVDDHEDRIRELEAR